MKNDDNRFRNLFVWDQDKIEDVRFWCEPALVTEAIQKIADFNFPEFDGFATFEARGFFLSGIAASTFQKPVVTIRKHKKFYDKMAHAKVNFTNWKGEEEALTVLDKTLPQVKRVLIVDDILDTGRSLIAGQRLLGERGIEIIGAFYLLDARRDQSPRFDFSIESILKHRLF